MVAFLPVTVRVMLLLRPSNNQFGALLSSPFPEDPRIVPADAIVAAQSTANATRANIRAVRFSVMVSLLTRSRCGPVRPGSFTDGCSADCSRRGLHKPRKILCLLPTGRNLPRFLVLTQFESTTYWESRSVVWSWNQEVAPPNGLWLAKSGMGGK